MIRGASGATEVGMLGVRTRQCLWKFGFIYFSKNIFEDNYASTFDNYANRAHELFN